MKSGRRLWPVAAGATLLAAVAVAAAGCGGGSDEASTGSNANDRRMDAALDWSRCMRENGVDVPDPQVGSGGLIQIGPRPGENAPPEATMRRAAEKCDEHLQRGGPGRAPSAADRARMEEAALAHARCMRKHGIDMPDPQFDSEGGGAAIRIDPKQTSSPAWNAAEKACNSLLERGPGQSE